MRLRLKLESREGQASLREELLVNGTAICQMAFLGRHLKGTQDSRTLLLTTLFMVCSSVDELLHQYLSASTWTLEDHTLLAHCLIKLPNLGCYNLKPSTNPPHVSSEALLVLLTCGEDQVPGAHLTAPLAASWLSESGRFAIANGRCW